MAGMKKKYILWDHDGVLVSTEEWYFEANKKALHEIGIDITKENYMYYMQNGISVWSIPKEQGISMEKITIQKNKRNEYYQHYLQTENIEIPGVMDVLKILKRSFSMAIITTSKKQDFAIIHKDRNMLQYMDFYLASGDYERAKPYPDPYLAGMHKYHALPDECIIIEDSARGLKSALSAGIDCIIIKHDFTKTHDFTGAKSIISNIEELPSVLSAM